MRDGAAYCPTSPFSTAAKLTCTALPWENAWLLIAITVPVGILVAALAGLGYAVRVARYDPIPMYFALHFMTLPAGAHAGDTRARRRPALPAHILFPGCDSRVGGLSGSPADLTG